MLHTAYHITSAIERTQNHEMLSASHRLLTPASGRRRLLRRRAMKLATAASLFLASLPCMLNGAGNPIPTSGLFYVSPTGNDSANGDINAPLATLVKAKELSVAWIHQQDGSGNYLNNAAEIFLRAGSYPVVSPATNPVAPGLEFTGAETRQGATITFRNHPGETAVIHGALEFVAANSAETGNWESVNLTVYNGGTTATSSPAAMKAVTVQKYVFSGALRAELLERITNLRAAGINGGHACFTEMYIDDTRKTRARHPNIRSIVADTSGFTVSEANKSNPLSFAQPIVRFNAQWAEQVQGSPFDDFSPVLNGHTELIFTRAWQWARGIITEGSLQMISGSPRLVARIGAMENPPLHIPPADNHDFTYDEGQLAEINSITSIDLTGPQETWNRCRLENNKLFVDQPGEWFFDDDEIALYYFPAAGEPITTEKFQFPVTYRLIALTGTEADPVTGIQFVGEGVGDFGSSSNYRLQFQKSAWKFENGRGNSEFYSASHGGYVQSGAIDGVYVDAFKVAYCKLSQFGSSGINLGGNRQWTNGRADRANYEHQTRGEVTNVILDNNYLTDGGGTAIRVEHYPRLNSDGTAPLDDNRITSNSITFIGKNFADGVGIHVAHATNTLISGNSISDVPFNGINVGFECFRGTNERLEVRSNGVVRAMRKLIDGAGIYTSGSRSMVIANNTLVSIGATRDVDAEDASSNARLITDLYFDLASRAFTVSANAASEIYADPGAHNFVNQGGTIYPLALQFDIVCPDPISDPGTLTTTSGCCGD